MPSGADVVPAGGDVVWALLGSEPFLFLSRDAGGTWEQRPMPPINAFGGASFVNDREGWIMALGSPTTQCHFQGASLWHTVDAGTSWSEVARAGRPDDANVQPLGSGCKSSLVFTDPEHGFVVSSSSDTGTRILRTTDGGRTWRSSGDLSIDGRQTGFSIGRVRAFGPTLLVDAVALSSSGRRSWILRSSDGGGTWSVLAAVPAELEWGPIGLATTTRWIALTLPTPLETTDAGRSWHPFTTSYAQAAPVPPSLVFADQLTAYSSVRGVIRRSDDGGAHWTAVLTPGTNPPCCGYDLPFRLPDGCRALGAKESGDRQEWSIDCGRDANDGARETVGRALDAETWRGCGFGLGAGYWQKGDQMVGVAEPADPALGFRLTVGPVGSPC